MKKMLFVPLLILALLLAACADGGAAQTPGALGTEPLGTEAGGLATEPLGTAAGVETDTGAATAEATTAATVAATEAATEAATQAATEAGTPVGQATTTAEIGFVAVPFDMFTVAQTAAGTGTGAGTPAAGTPEGTAGAAGTEPAGTAAAGTEPAGTAAAGTEPAGTAAAGTEPAGAATQTAGQTEGEELLVRASDLMGSEIVDMNGDTVGTVEEVLVDETGAIQHVIFDAADYMAGAGTGTGAGTPAAGTPEGTAGAAGTEPAGTAAAGTEPAGTAAAGTEPAGTAAAGTEPAGAGTQAAGTPEAISTSTVGEGTAVAQGTQTTGVMADENTVLVFNGTPNDLQTQAIMLTEEMMDAEGPSFVVAGADVPADMAQLEGMLRVSRLTETEVTNAQDEALGQVEDWIVDLRQGMVQYGVVDFGGFLGLAENTVAVPWEQFTVATGSAEADAGLMLDVTEDTLQNAPQLNMSDWPSWPQPIPSDWETETRTFWETAS